MQPLKQQVLELIRSMPDDCTIDAIRGALQHLEQGKPDEDIGRSCALAQVDGILAGTGASETEYDEYLAQKASDDAP